LFLSSIEVKNFRNIKDIKVVIDNSLTVIVGKNNSGKTSFMKSIYNVLEKDEYNYYDYPLNLVEKLEQKLINFKKENFSEDSFIDMQNNINFCSVIFDIDYSDDIDNSELGFLSDFIIDLDDKVFNAKIEARYSFDIKKDMLKNLIENYHKDIIDTNFIESNFKKFFKLQVISNSIIDRKHTRIVDVNSLRQLIKFKYLDAERFMGESNSSSSIALNELVKKLFSSDFVYEDEHVQNTISELRRDIYRISDNFQTTVNTQLSKIVDETRKFTGYPGADELPLGVKSSIELLETLTNNNLSLIYRDKFNHELPNGNNGLGYKNLINIVFQIQNYIEDLDIKNFIGIPLLMIEEPESHMHPQLQTTFIKYINAYVCEFLNEKSNLQIVITTHASHIANSVDFDKIRYFKKSQSKCVVKDLKEYIETDIENIEFLTKYMTLSNCDIYFADKLILIEGAGERLLLNNMIEKVSDELEKKVLPCSNNIPLKTQYISYIEVGGAYAYVFFKLLEFLEIPSLVVTDIDPIGKDNKRCLCKDGESTSNATIKRWYLQNVLKKTKFNISQKRYPMKESIIPFADIEKMDWSEKIMNTIILTFQEKEDVSGYMGRSLEQSIIAANTDLYLDEEQVIDEETIENAFDQSSSKMDFALDLLVNKENSEQKFIVPKYIKEGLMRLANFGSEEEN
jgi:predicted ATP-dependent endonuclease of OLD family